MSTRRYRVLSRVVFGAGAPLWRRHPKLREGWPERAGRYPKARFALWAHGASAGDVLALEPTLRALKDQGFADDALVSTVTDSGYRAAQRFADHVRYVPLDTRRARSRLSRQRTAGSAKTPMTPRRGAPS